MTYGGIFGAVSAKRDALDAKGHLAGTIYAPSSVVPIRRVRLVERALVVFHTWPIPYPTPTITLFSVDHIWLVVTFIKTGSSEFFIFWASMWDISNKGIW